MAPFTPATGRRLLIAEGEDADAITAGLLAGARAAADEIEASSIHLLFLTDEERRRVIDLGFRPRLSLQFHWDNDGYESFDDYLARFRSSKRKQVRKERRRVAESDLEITVKEGPELDDGDWRALERLYRENCMRHGSYGYLTKSFFHLVRRTYAHRLVTVLAYQGGTAVAASINFEKGAHLYGRYWGCEVDHEFLHFELCYYRLIERAIDKGMRHFEAGAQGFHKLKRGLMPTGIHSAHWIRDARLAHAVDQYLPSEAGQVRGEIAMLEKRSPFQRG
jgi:predicted N-acyltransferase